MTGSNCDLVLIRHPPVAARYRGLCYGQSDVELSPAGLEQSKSLADDLARNLSENRRGLAHFAESSEQNVPVPLSSKGCRIGSKLNPTKIFHSGLMRTQIPAERIAQQTGARQVHCNAIRERNFGRWELQSWDDIYKNSQDDIDRLVSEPATFHPPGGETTFELRDRVVHWFESLPQHGVIVAVTHGGPIAALLGHLDALPVEDWASRIPAAGERICVNRAARRIVC